MAPKENAGTDIDRKHYSPALTAVVVAKEILTGKHHITEPDKSFRHNIRTIVDEQLRNVIPNAISKNLLFLINMVNKVLGSLKRMGVESNM